MRRPLRCWWNLNELITRRSAQGHGATSGTSPGSTGEAAHRIQPQSGPSGLMERAKGLVLTVWSFSRGISKAHLSLESISSSGFASFHWGNRRRLVTQVRPAGTQSWWNMVTRPWWRVKLSQYFKASTTCRLLSVCYSDRTTGRKLLHCTEDNCCLSATITCTSQKAGFWGGRGGGAL